MGALPYSRPRCSSMFPTSVLIYQLAIDVVPARSPAIRSPRDSESLPEGEGRRPGCLATLSSPSSLPSPCCSLSPSPSSHPAHSTTHSYSGCPLQNNTGPSLTLQTSERTTLAYAVLLRKNLPLDAVVDKSNCGRIKLKKTFFLFFISA